MREPADLAPEEIAPGRPAATSLQSEQSLLVLRESTTMMLMPCASALYAMKNISRPCALRLISARCFLRGRRSRMPTSSSTARCGRGVE